VGKAAAGLAAPTVAPDEVVAAVVAAGVAELACVFRADGLVVEVGDVNCGRVDAWEEAA
jgi:hypothetical protein